MEEGELVEVEVKVASEVAVEMEVAAAVEMEVEVEVEMGVEVEVGMAVEAVPEEAVMCNNLAGIGETQVAALAEITAYSHISLKTRTLDKTPALEHQFHEMEAM